jgi:hypothetical protein
MVDLQEAHLGKLRGESRCEGVESCPVDLYAAVPRAERGPHLLLDEPLAQGVVQLDPGQGQAFEQGREPPIRTSAVERETWTREGEMILSCKKASHSATPSGS